MLGTLAVLALCATTLLTARDQPPAAAAPQGASSLDTQVKTFLDSRRGTWRDLNVPEVDGRTLHDLIVQHEYTRALEIGTSTGHSAIWMAWALSKNGGRLLTIEVDPARHRTAVANFKEAGVAPYIDARLANAHELVPQLEGPFDFVFSDADKDWYARYLEAVWPKLLPGGRFTAHNVSMRNAGVKEFLAALERLPDGRTTIDRQSPEWISITVKQPR
jgi:caffeoyl-CoA O-methyltransferase